MRRSVLLLGCLLAVVTSLALLRTADSLTTPALLVSSAPASREDDVALVRRFYDAANAVLAGGDAAGLDPIVAADLIEHPARLDGSSGRVGLAVGLRALGTIYPDLRLVVDDVQATGMDEVTVRVHGTGGMTGLFLGLPVSGEAAGWGPLEVFRVAENRIVEHWSSAGEPVVLRPLAVTSLTRDGEENEARLVALTRLDFAPETTSTIGTGGATRLFVVERGTVRARGLPGSRAAEATSTATGRPMALPSDDWIRLSEGDTIVAPPGARFAATNAGESRASALVMTVFGIEWGRDEGAAWSDAAFLVERPGLGLTAHVLATDTLVVPDRAVLAAGRVTVAPGAEFVAAGTGTTLVAVAPGTPGTVPAADEGGLVPPGVTITYRPQGGTRLTATVFTVQPAALATPPALAPS